MAFPTIQSRATTAASADQTSHAVNLPASIAAGDYLIMAFALDDTAGTITTPTGWTAQQSQSANDRLSIFTKTADGTESGTVTVSTSSSQSSSAIVWRVTGVTGISSSANSPGTTVTFSGCPAVTANTTADAIQICTGISQGTNTVAAFEEGTATRTTVAGDGTSATVLLYAVDGKVAAISGESPCVFTWTWTTAFNRPRATILLYGTAASGGGGSLINSQQLVRQGWIG